MLITKSGFYIFNEYDLQATLENQLSTVKKEIEKDLASGPIGDESEYIARKVESQKILPLTFDTENIKLTTTKGDIPAEYFPFGFFVNPGDKYEKEVLTFHLPFKGDSALLKSIPSMRVMWTEEVAVEGNEVIFELINFSNNIEDIGKERDKLVDFLVKQASHINNQVNEYNDKLTNVVTESIKKIRGELTTHSEFLAKLGTPLKVNLSDNISGTDSPKPSKSHITEKESKKYDVFICHASEDEDYVQKLAGSILKEGITVWYDGFVLKWGDNLRSSIDEGLMNSRYGIVVFSKAFLRKKKWTEYELDGLFKQEKPGQSIILPLLYDITVSEFTGYSPSLSTKIAKSSASIESIVVELKALLNK
jgi:hypothetical protein